MWFSPRKHGIRIKNRKNHSKITVLNYMSSMIDYWQDRLKSSVCDVVHCDFIRASLYKNLHQNLKQKYSRKFMVHVSCTSFFSVCHRYETELFIIKIVQWVQNKKRN